MKKYFYKSFDLLASNATSNLLVYSVEYKNILGIEKHSEFPYAHYHLCRKESFAIMCILISASNFTLFQIDEVFHVNNILNLSNDKKKMDHKNL